MYTFLRLESFKSFRKMKTAGEKHVQLFSSSHYCTDPPRRLRQPPATMRSFIALRLLGVLAAVGAVSANVEVLDDQSFTALVESGEPAFVKFYAPCASPPPPPPR